MQRRLPVNLEVDVLLLDWRTGDASLQRGRAP